MSREIQKLCDYLIFEEQNIYKEYTYQSKFHADKYKKLLKLINNHLNTNKLGASSLSMFDSLKLSIEETIDQMKKDFSMYNVFYFIDDEYSYSNKYIREYIFEYQRHDIIKHFIITKTIFQCFQDMKLKFPFFESQKSRLGNEIIEYMQYFISHRKRFNFKIKIHIPKLNRGIIVTSRNF